MIERMTTGPGAGARKPLDRTAVRFHIYRLLAADGSCLYIGRSSNPLTRLKAHHAATEWASRVVEIEGHGPYTWDEAVHLERESILRERPAHNIDGVTRHTGRIDVTQRTA